LGQAFAVAAGDMTGVPVGSFSGARKLRDAALVPGLSKGAPLERRGRGGDKAGANEDKVGRIWSVGPARIGFQDSAALNPRARPAPEWWSPIVCPAKGPHQSITLMGTQAGDPVWAPAFAGAQFAEHNSRKHKGTASDRRSQPFAGMTGSRTAGAYPVVGEISRARALSCAERASCLPPRRDR